MFADSLYVNLFSGETPDKYNGCDNYNWIQLTFAVQLTRHVNTGHDR